MKSLALAALFTLSFCPLAHAEEDHHPARLLASSEKLSVRQESPPQVASILGFPKYQLHRPEWGFQFSFSPRTFSGQGLSPSQGSRPTFAYQLLFEYQPSFLQGLGVLGVGPSISLYSFPDSKITSQLTSVYSYGGQIRYQARYFREQYVVPIIAYSFEILNSELIDPTSGATTSKDKVRLQGPTFGAWILLNFLDRSSANSLYINTGVSRTYLTLEAKKSRGSLSQVQLNHWSYFVGLRLEL